MGQGWSCFTSEEERQAWLDTLLAAEAMLKALPAGAEVIRCKVRVGQVDCQCRPAACPHQLLNLPAGPVERFQMFSVSTLHFNPTACSEAPYPAHAWMVVPMKAR